MDVEKDSQRRTPQNILLFCILLLFFILFPSPFGMVMLGVYIGMFIRSEAKDNIHLPLILAILLFLPIMLLQYHGHIRFYAF